MTNRAFIFSLLFTALTLCSGCWDRREINDLAFVMASSLDMTEDGHYLGTIQMVAPSRALGVTAKQEKKYFLDSAKGNNVQSVAQGLQLKLSRKMFVAHRRVLFIGERLARHGVDEIMDYYSRVPATRLRTYVVIVKGMEGQEALKIDYPIEFVPTEAVREMENISGGSMVTIRDFIMAMSGQGIDPMADAIALVPKTAAQSDRPDDGKTFKLSGIAIFRKMKLLGYLNPKETLLTQWITGKLKYGSLYVQSDHKDKISISITTTSRKIEPKLKGNRLVFAVRLKGEGNVVENNTKLDLSDPKNLKRIEDSLNTSLKKQSMELFANVQHRYGADIFGFGMELHKKNNKAWKTLKDDWSEHFANAEIDIECDFRISRTGMTGSPLQLPEDQIIK